MNKKVLVSLGVMAGLVFISEIGFADELEDMMRLYLQNDNLDFLGREYDKQFFKLLEGEDPTILDKIKAIPQDLKTIPLQIKCNWKMITQKENAIAYTTLVTSTGLKSAIGGKEFNKIVLKLLKIVIK